MKHCQIQKTSVNKFFFFINCIKCSESRFKTAILSIFENIMNMLINKLSQLPVNKICGRHAPLKF